MVPWLGLDEAIDQRGGLGKTPLVKQDGGIVQQRVGIVADKKQNFFKRPGRRGHITRLRARVGRAVNRFGQKGTVFESGLALISAAQSSSSRFVVLGERIRSRLGVDTRSQDHRE